MIVNTAYIYMGSGGGGTPVNPNLWQDGVSNYPVVFTNSKITSKGLQFNKYGAGDATFSELTLTHLNSLTLSGSIEGGSISAKVEIGIDFYSSDNMLIGTATASFSRSGNSVAVDIPSSAKIQNAKIKIRKDAASSPTLTLSSALLS